MGNSVPPSPEMTHTKCWPPSRPPHRCALGQGSGANGAGTRCGWVRCGQVLLAGYLMSLLCRATRRALRRNLLLWPVPLLHPGRLPSQRAACRRLPLPWEPGQQVGVEGWPGLWRGPVWARRRCLRPGNNMQRNLQKFPETDSPGGFQSLLPRWGKRLLEGRPAQMAQQPGSRTLAQGP